jgi:hypothetical protein
MDERFGGRRMQVVGLLKESGSAGTPGRPGGRAIGELREEFGGLRGLIDTPDETRVMISLAAFDGAPDDSVLDICFVELAVDGSPSRLRRDEVSLGEYLRPS